MSKEAKKTYFFINDLLNVVKIGSAKVVEKRLKQVQTGFPYSLRILAQYDMNIERELHIRFAKYRLEREWFKYEGEVVDFIENGDYLSYLKLENIRGYHNTFATFVTQDKKIVFNKDTGVIHESDSNLVFKSISKKEIDLLSYIIDSSYESFKNEVNILWFEVSMTPYELQKALDNLFKLLFTFQQIKLGPYVHKKKGYHYCLKPITAIREKQGMFTVSVSPSFLKEITDFHVNFFN